MSQHFACPCSLNKGDQKNQSCEDTFAQKTNSLVWLLDRFRIEGNCLQASDTEEMQNLNGILTSSSLNSLLGSDKQEG